MQIKKSFGERIYLEWNDAISKEGWKSVEDALKYDDEAFCKTNAFYIGENKEYITVAATIGKTKKNDVGGVWQIPKKWILKIK